MKFFIITFCLSAFHSFGQNEWSLQQCIDSSLLNNRDIHISVLLLNQAEIKKSNAIYTFFPILNGGATHGYNWGQTIDPFTNQFASDRVQYNNFYLSSSVTLFSGLQLIHSKRLLQIDFESQRLNSALVQRNKRIEVTTAFLQSSLNQEIIFISEKAIELSIEELKRNEILLEEKNSTKSNLLKVEAQLARERYALQLAKNDYHYSLLLLQQLIGLDYDSTFSISNQPKITTHESKYDANNSLEIQLALLDEERQKTSIKKTKGQLFPKLSLNGSIGSGYSENNTILAPDGSFVPKPLDSQLNENFYQSASATLSIPIFNNNRVKSEIKISELETDRVRLKNEQSIREFENKIQQFQMEIFNNQSLLESLNIVYESSKLDFENSKLLYENGSLNYVEFLRSKNILFEVEFELIQAKYKLEFSRIIMTLIH